MAPGGRITAEPWHIIIYSWVDASRRWIRAQGVARNHKDEKVSLVAVSYEEDLTEASGAPSG